MNFLKMIKRSLVLGLLYSQSGLAQSVDSIVIPLNNFNAFRDPGKNWIVSSDATADYTKPNDMKPVKGEGAVVNDMTRNNQMHLVTKAEFGDLFLELDFMMAKNSNSGIYFQGRYEIQLLDSWTRLSPTSGDLGGIYSRNNTGKGSVEGTPPIMNVARAPGLWQHLSVKFRAPRFNDKGEKITDAKFEEVYINGTLVQQEAFVTGPTNSAIYQDEKAKGPLMIQGDHGQVAIRNVNYRETWLPDPGPKGDQYWIPGSPYWETVNPVIVNPGVKPAFIKTFLMYGPVKLTHVLSVGNPSQVNYSYDVKQGALFQIWRGQFLDLSMAWIDRGGMQLSRPLGSVITLSDAPAVATLADEKTAWPDSIAFDSMDNKGYALDKQRSPTFTYLVSGMTVTDSILSMTNGEGIVRTISVTNAPANLYNRVIAGKTIVNISGDLYAVNDKSFYIRVDKKYKPIIRQTANGQEIIVKYNPADPLTYSIIW